MLALILGAVRTRTAQALTVLILTALAAAAAAAGPWYGLAAGSRAAAADVASAPAGERTLSVRKLFNTNGDPRTALKLFADSVRGVLPIADGTPALGITAAMSTRRGLSDPPINVSYRDGFCQHVHLDGACPAAPADVAISRTLAQQLGITIGSPLTIRASSATEPVHLRVVARYDLTDPTGAYWSDTLFRAGNNLDPVFTSVDAFANRQLWQSTFAYDIDVPEHLIRGDNGYDLAGTLRVADQQMGASSLNLVNPTGAILDAIARDRAAIRLGVFVALGQVLVLAWFAIGLTGRYTGRDRRPDAALLKLRGSTRSGMLRLTSGQHLLPLIGGVVLGAPIGFLVAWALAGHLPVTTERGPALAQSALAVGAVLLGGLIVLTVVDAVVLRLPVVALLRRVPAGRRDWRADVVDLALLAVAVAAIYQARSSGPGSGLGLVAPALVALAVALLLARLLGRVADRAGGVAVRRGRLRFGLTAVAVSRQPGTDRVFALIVVAVAMFATAAGGYAAARTERGERSDVELGAARVLTVQTDTRTGLEYAVRRADPAGRYAMAAVVDLAAVPPVLTVDTTRLAAVARWRSEYGPLRALPDATAAARVPTRLPLVTGTGLTLRAVNAHAVPLAVNAILQNETTGLSESVRLGPIAAGEHTVSAPVTGCGPESGCRFVRWELVQPQAGGRPPAIPDGGAAVTIRSLAQQDPPGPILDTAQLTDVGRWRSDLAGAGMDIDAGDGGLTITIDRNVLNFAVTGNAVYAVDAPLPLPILMAGPPPPGWQTGEPGLVSFGAGSTPVKVVGTASVLPVLGDTGVVVDFDATRRIAADADLRGTFQVWLSADAPPSIVDALRTAGLQVVADDSVAARSARLAEQGPAIAAKFALVLAALGLLLAAAAIAVTAAVDRRPQLEQLDALRVQGLSRRTAVATGWAGSAALVVAGLIGGVIAAAIARPVAGAVAPPFTDGWRVVPAPTALSAVVLALAGAVALVAFGVTAWLSVLPLVRRLRGGDR
jgi:putative ABC transport system permease protein